MTENRYNDLLNDARKSLDYWSEATILDFTEEIVRHMEREGISRSDLARRLNSSQAYVTKVLKGKANFTVASMTKLARVFDLTVRVHLAPENAVVRWQEDCITTDSSINVPSEDRRRRIIIHNTAQTYDVNMAAV